LEEAIAYNKSSDQNRRRQMPAKDLYHEAVKNALIKDGWTITADPYPIEFDILAALKVRRFLNLTI
jgi:hypothetical protein